MSKGINSSFALILSILGALVLPTSSSDAQSLSAGWWVIIASMPANDASRMGSDLDRFTASAARCGFKAFNDFSSKFKGFKPGYNVFVVGAYASQTAAQEALSEIRPCAAGAYIKYGEYLGE